jgi:RNA ligase (TIGR02306 family)
MTSPTLKRVTISVEGPPQAVDSLTTLLRFVEACGTLGTTRHVALVIGGEGGGRMAVQIDGQDRHLTGAETAFLFEGEGDGTDAMRCQTVTVESSPDATALHAHPSRSVRRGYFTRRAMMSLPMKRKLASVVRVSAVHPIKDADRIELAQVAGWQCVVKKGEVVPDALAVYLEIDAIPPDTESFAWLWQQKNASARLPRPANFRIRTLRLRGQLSQGLLMPLSQLGLSDVSEGDDLTERLGIVKYEPPAPSGMGDYRGPFPSIVPKTDELRVQSFPAVLGELRGQPFVATVKMDGTSVTFVKVDGTLHVCGRNHSIAEGENLYWYVATKRRLGQVLDAHPTLALQGEVVGPGIQKNPAGLTDKDVFLFSAYDWQAGRFLSDAQLRSIGRAFDVPIVPIAFEGEAFDETLESLLLRAEGLYPGTSNQREGVVVRPKEDLRSEVLGGRLSFKAISNRYLLDERD